MAPDSATHADFPETDPAALERLRRFGGDKLVADMITLFLEAVPQRLGAARSGFARGEPHVVEHELHALKSSAAQLGALRMHRLSQEGELLAKAGTLDGVGRILDDLFAEEPRVREWLTAARSRETA
jgi:HPt (histidine-containing phosphotransfer) domain-containing protein